MNLIRESPIGFVYCIIGKSFDDLQMFYFNKKTISFVLISVILFETVFCEY